MTLQQKSTVETNQTCLYTAQGQLLCKKKYPVNNAYGRNIEYNINQTQSLDSIEHFRDTVCQQNTDCSSLGEDYKCQSSICIISGPGGPIGGSGD